MPHMKQVFLGKSDLVLRLAAHRMLSMGTDAPEGSPVDLRRFHAALPGRRAIRLFMRYLQEFCGELGRSLLPPSCVTPGQLEELLTTRDLPLITPAEEKISWLLALKSSPSEDLEPLGIDPDLSGTSGLLAMGKLFSRITTTLRTEGLNPGAAAHIAADRDQECALRLRALEKIENRRQGFLRDWDVSQSGFNHGAPTQPQAEVILIGLMELPKRTREWLAEHTRCEIWTDALEQDQHLYDEYGRPDPAEWENTSMPDPEHFLVTDTPQDLALAMIDHVSQIDEIKKTSDVRLGVADNDLMPWISESFRRNSTGLHLAAGQPYSLTACGRLITGIKDAISNETSGALVALARYPEILSWLPSRTDRHGKTIPVIKDLDQWCRDRQPVLGDDPGAPPAVAALSSALAPLHRREDEFLQRLDQYIEVLSGLLRSDEEGMPNWPESGSETLVEILENLRSCGLWTACHLTGEELAHLIHELTTDAMLPEDDDGLSIEALGWLELPMDNAPHLILSGISEGRLSGSSNSDPLLPERLRRELDIPGFDARVARDSHHLYNLLDGRRKVSIALAARDAEGNPMLPSRLLLRGNNGIERLKTFLDHKHRILLSEKRPERETENTDLADLGPPRWKSVLPPEKISVTAFGRWLTDPVLFQMETMLSLRDCHDRDRQLNPLSFGNMLHWVLEKYGKSETDRDLKDAKEIYVAAENWLQEYTKRKLARHPRAAVLVQVEQAKARLEIWAREQAKIRFQGWHIVATEINLDPKNCKLEIEGQSLGVSGRIDRIDYNKRTGAWRIFDYKTGDHGHSPERDHGRRPGKETPWKKLQLPLYKHFSPTLVIDGKQVSSDSEVGFFCLPGKSESPSVMLAKWTEDDQIDAVECATNVVREILNPEEPETRVLKSFSHSWERAFAGVTVDAESSLSEMGQDDEEDSE